MTYDSCPFSYQQLEQAQLADKQVMEILKLDKSAYKYHSFHGGTIRQLICKNNKIVVAKLLQKHVIDWYHTVLCHPGINRTEETIAQHLWWPKMRDQITNFVSACTICQKNKRKQKKYGILPPKEAEALIWDKMCIDLIGPYKIRRKG